MRYRITRNLASDNVAVRIATTFIGFLIVFCSITVVSYYLLPQGFLLEKNPMQNWDTSPNLILSSLQIFAYNLLSIVVILLSNMLAWRKTTEDNFIAFGYLAFFGQITINAIVLGTWSFSIAPEAVPLLERIVGTFDILHRAGIWEISGQLFILCATAKISLLLYDDKKTIKKNWRTIKLSKPEVIALVIGFASMITGALIESYSIINL